MTRLPIIPDSNDQQKNNLSSNISSLRSRELMLNAFITPLLFFIYIDGGSFNGSFDGWYGS